MDLALTIALATSLACGEARPRHRADIGTSGTVWRVLAQKPFTAREGQQAIEFRYETDVSLDDREALTAEIELFLADRSDLLDRGSFGVVVVEANTAIKSGWAESRDQHRFRFARSADGTWSKLRDIRANDVSGGAKTHVH